MSYSIGDGLVALALAGGVVGYVYVTHQTRVKRMAMIHQERMAAMEKGIPLPEFPLEDGTTRIRVPADTVVPLLGVVLSSLSIGTMVVLYRTLEGESHGFWVSPLPFAFLGVGFLVYHFLHRDERFRG